MNEPAWVIESASGDLGLGAKEGHLAWVPFTDESVLRFARQIDGLRARQVFGRVGYSDTGDHYIRLANVNQREFQKGPGQ